MAKLVLSSGGSILYQCFLDKERLHVGKNPDNQVVIDDPAVSEEHAVIIPVGNDHILENVQSINGTFVNGSRVIRHLLQHGDVMQLGAFYLRYLNPRASSDRDLERTMLAIAGLWRASSTLRSANPASSLKSSRMPAAHFGKH